VWEEDAPEEAWDLDRGSEEESEGERKRRKVKRRVPAAPLQQIVAQADDIVAVSGPCVSLYLPSAHSYSRCNSSPAIGPVHAFLPVRHVALLLYSTAPGVGPSWRLMLRSILCFFFVFLDTAGKFMEENLPIRAPAPACQAGAGQGGGPRDDVRGVHGPQE